MLLLVADERDTSVPWIVDAVPDVSVVAATDLGSRAGFALHQDGRVDARPPTVTWSGPSLDPAGAGTPARAVMCRVPVVGVDHLGFEGDDAEYARAEWTACLAGMLQAAGHHLVNRSSATMLAGRWLGPDESAIAAHQVGLPVDASGRPAAQGFGGAADDVVVVGARVFSRHELDPTLASGLVRLADHLGLRVCGFTAADADWRSGPIVDLVVTPCPHLVATGAAGGAAFRELIESIAVGGRRDRPMEAVA